MTRIFVFGSNLWGYHGAGAALFAKKKRGAKWGVGEGRTGQAYALPTVVKPRIPRTLYAIRQSANRFLVYAFKHPDLEFQVTQVGCGLGGFTKEQIAPLFMNGEVIPENVYFDSAWKTLLPEVDKFWGTM